MRKLLLLIMAALLITIPALAAKLVDEQSYTKAKEELKTEGSVPFIDALHMSLGKGHLKGFVPPRAVFIIGGRRVDTIKYFPWQVSIEFAQAPSNLQGHLCAGSLVKPNWVVTAAHCVDNGTTPEQIIVVTGADYLSDNLSPPPAGVIVSTGVSTTVTKIILHPEYGVGMNNDNDIALVQLASKVASSPIPLITTKLDKQLDASTVKKAAKVKNPAIATIIGWGYTTENGPVSPTLQVAEVPIVGRKTCNSVDDNNGQVTDNMICAGKGNVDSCLGDSGGPLMVKNSKGAYVLAGITSWGEGCAKPGKSGVYTRVAKYVKWVNQTIKSE